MFARFAINVREVPRMCALAANKVIIEVRNELVTFRLLVYLKYFKPFSVYFSLAEIRTSVSNDNDVGGISDTHRIIVGAEPGGK